MRRPLMIIGFTYLFSLACCCFVSENAALVFGLVFLVSFIILTVIPFTRKLVIYSAVCLTAAMAFFSFYFSMELTVKPVKNLGGTETTVTAELIDLPQKSGESYSYMLKAFKDDEGIERDFKFKLFSREEIGADIGDTVRCRVKFYSVDNYSRGDYLMRYLSRGIYLNGYVSGSVDDVITAPALKKSLYRYAADIRLFVKGASYKLYDGKVPGLMNAVLLGDISDVDDQSYQSLKAAGIVHIVSVSGLHVAIASSAIFGFLTFLKVKRKSASVAVILSNIAFMAITGFSMSVVRAGIMIVVYYAAQLFRRQSDSFNSLGLAALVILLFNPFAVADIGFLLSFSSTLGIITLNPYAKEKKIKYMDKIKPPLGKKIFGGAFSAITVTVSATLFSFPLVVVFIGSFSTVAVLANLATAIPVTAILIAGLIAALLYPLWFLKVFLYIVVFIAEAATNITLILSNFFASLPFAYISLDGAFNIFWILATLVMLSYVIFTRLKARMIIRAVIFSFIIYLAGAFGNIVFYAKKPYIITLDSSNGLSAAVVKERSAVVLSCGGNNYSGKNLANTLKAKGITDIKCLILPTLEKNNASGAIDFLQVYSPQMTVMPDKGKYFTQVEPYVGDYRLISNQSRLVIDDFCTVDFYAYDKKASLLVEAEGKRALMTSGIKSISELPDDFLDFDCLISSETIPEGLHEYCTVFSSDEEAAAINKAQYYTAFSKNITLILSD